MTSNGILSDRHSLPCPGDGQDEPADDLTTAVGFSDPDNVNWGDLYQTLVLGDQYLDGRLVASGTLASRESAGTNAPKLHVVTNGGGSSDQVYLTYNDDSAWYRPIGISERTQLVEATDSPYSLSNGEEPWVTTGSGNVDLNLPAPDDGTTVSVVVVDASNTTTLVRDGTETIDGDAADLTINSERAVRLRGDGSNWRTVADTGGASADTLDGPGLIAQSDQLSVQERIHYSPGHTEVPDGDNDVEYHRIVPPSGGTVTITAMQYNQQGGGSSANSTLDVYDAGAASVVNQITLGSQDRSTYTAGSGNTVLVRLSNSTGSTVDAAPVIDGYIA